METRPSIRPRIQGDRLAVLTNGGGAGVPADALSLQDGQLAELGTDTLDKLNAHLPIWSHGDPVDIIGDADGARAAALDVLTHARRPTPHFVLNCPTALASGRGGKGRDRHRQNHNRPILTNRRDRNGAAARRLFSEAKIPPTKHRSAVRGFIGQIWPAPGHADGVPPSLATSFKPDTIRARKYRQRWRAARAG